MELVIRFNLCLGREWSGVPAAIGGGTSCWKFDDGDAAGAELSCQIEDGLIASNDSQLKSRIQKFF